jgi:hypothetical protein
MSGEADSVSALGGKKKSRGSGIFRRIKGRRGSPRNDGEEGDGESYYSSERQGTSVMSSSDGTADTSVRRRKGLGARIRGMVRGRRRRDAAGGGGGGSVDGSSLSETSLYDHSDPGGAWAAAPPNGNSHQLQQQLQHHQPHHHHGGGGVASHNSVDSHTLEQVIEEEEEDYDDDYEYEDEIKDGSTEDAGPRVLPNKAKANLMMSKKAKELPHDSVSDADLSRITGFGSSASETPPPPSGKKGRRRGGAAAANGKAEPLTGGLPLALVLLLLDPHSLRFELLQLEFSAPHRATVQDVLDQIPTSVTEPTLRRVPFVGLVDRAGRGYKGKAPLSVACQNRPPRRGQQQQQSPHRDVLVGLTSAAGVEGTARLARPIFGDRKVVSMLEANGYPMEGWTLDVGREANLPHTDASSSSNNRQRGGKRRSVGPALVKLLLAAVLAVAAAVLYLAMKDGTPPHHRAVLSFLSIGNRTAMDLKSPPAARRLDVGGGKGGGGGTLGTNAAKPLPSSLGTEAKTDL